MRDIVAARDVFRGIDAKTVAGPEPGREHPEVLEVRAGITGGFESVLFEDVRDVIGSDPQLRRSVATSLKFVRGEIGRLFA